MHINKYNDIADSLLERIACGEITERLPSFRQLVKEYQVSKRTFGKAMKLLNDAGYTLPGPRGTRLNPDRKPRKRTRRIVILTDDYDNAAENMLYKLLMEMAVAAGNTFDHESPSHLREPLADGYIFYGGTFDAGLAERFRKEGVAAVSVNMLSEELQMSWVDLSCRDAFFRCIDLMRSLRKKRIAFYHPMGNLTASRENWQMVYHDFLEERRDFKLRDSELEFFYPNHSNDGEEFVDFLLKQKKMPEVIMQINWHDELYQALQNRQLLDMGNITMMCLKVSAQDCHNWAQETLLLLEKRIRNPYAPCEQVRVPVINRFEEIHLEEIKQRGNN